MGIINNTDWLHNVNEWMEKLNPDVKVITTSLKEGKGLDEVIEAIKDAKAHEAEHHHHHDHDHDHHHDHDHEHEHSHEHEHHH